MNLSISIQQFNHFTGHRASVFALANAEAPNCFFSADGNGWIVAWNINQPDLGSLVAQVPSNVFSICHIPAQQMLAVGSMQGALFFIDIAQNKVIEPPLQLGKSVFSIALSGNKLYAGTGNGQLWTLQLPDLKIRQVSSVSNSSIRSIHQHPTLPMLALGCSDNQIYILNTDDRKIVQQLTFHQNSVFSVRFSPDGQYLLSGSRDACLAVWQFNAMQQLQLLHSIPAHLFTINSITYSPNGELFATAARDKTIKIWQANNFALLKVIDNTKPHFSAHKNSVNSLLWLPYNNLLLSAGDDRNVFAWQIPLANIG